VLPLI